MQIRSAVGHQHTLKFQQMPATWQPHPEVESLHIISLTHNYGKENQREHCRRFTRLDFCRSCLQLMMSRNTAVCRCHGIFVGLGRYWYRVSNSNRYSEVSNSIEYRPILSLYSVSMPINNKCTTSANFFLYLCRWTSLDAFSRHIAARCQLVSVCF